MFSPECKTPEEVFVAKPSAVIESWYGPGAMFAMEYCPSSPIALPGGGLVLARELHPGAGTAVPFGSTIVPWMVPEVGVRSCALKKNCPLERLRIGHALGSRWGEPAELEHGPEGRKAGQQDLTRLEFRARETGEDSARRFPAGTFLVEITAIILQPSR